MEGPQESRVPLNPYKSQWTHMLSCKDPYHSQEFRCGLNNDCQVVTSLDNLDVTLRKMVCIQQRFHGDHTWHCLVFVSLLPHLSGGDLSGTTATYFHHTPCPCSYLLHPLCRVAKNFSYNSSQMMSHVHIAKYQMWGRCSLLLFLPRTGSNSCSLCTLCSGYMVYLHNAEKTLTHIIKINK